ncbi:hypothetical protein GCM10009104_13090 [Marinobacterium maritimum]|uniref:Uncharacterized protein n=1 Tax=Marinobacterium maritimum TaxID=500162 RepID=A0ABP3TAK6_9GAMM
MADAVTRIENWIGRPRRAERDQTAARSTHIELERRNTAKGLNPIGNRLFNNTGKGNCEEKRCFVAD